MFKWNYCRYVDHFLSRSFCNFPCICMICRGQWSMWMTVSFPGCYTDSLTLSISVLALDRCCLCFCRSAWLLLSAFGLLPTAYCSASLCQFVALKPICFLTVCFHFSTFWFSASVHFNPSVLHNQSLYNTSRGDSHLFHNG